MFSLQLHKQADMQEEKNRIERVLGAISQPELIQKVLTFALSVSFLLFGEAKLPLSLGKFPLGEVEMQEFSSFCVMCIRIFYWGNSE